MSFTALAKRDRIQRSASVSRSCDSFTAPRSSSPRRICTSLVAFQILLAKNFPVSSRFSSNSRS